MAAQANPQSDQLPVCPFQANRGRSASEMHPLAPTARSHGPKTAQERAQLQRKDVYLSGALAEQYDTEWKKGLKKMLQETKSADFYNAHVVFV